MSPDCLRSPALDLPNHPVRAIPHSQSSQRLSLPKQFGPRRLPTLPQMFEIASHREESEEEEQAADSLMIP